MHENKEFVFKADQVINVDKEPDDPGKKTRELDFSVLHDCLAATDGRHHLYWSLLYSTIVGCPGLPDRELLFWKETERIRRI